MRTVLFITYYFPPAGGPGVQRALSFVRHLPEYGWQPVVLTVEGGTFPNTDEAGLSKVPPDVPVYRARTIEPFAIFNRLRGKPADEEIPFWYTGSRERQGILMRLSRWVRANFFIPDGRVGWVPFASRAARDVIRIHRPDAILTSSPPNSVQLIGKRAALSSALPWVADLRDPWTQVLYNRDLPRMWPARRLDKWLEQRSLSATNAVTCTTETVRATLDDAGRGATVLANGYEEEDFLGEVRPPANMFTLTFVGNLSEQIDMTPFLRTIRGEIDGKTAFADSFRLRLVGSVSVSARKMIREFGLEGFVDVPGFIPHEEAVNEMRRSTCLLFAAAHDELHAKLFEYLASGRPILALGKQGGNTDQLLREAGREGVIPVADQKEIGARIRSLFSRWTRGDLATWAPMEGVERFSRRELTGVLAGVLDSVV